MTIAAFAAAAPWWGKIAAKLVLSLLPVSSATWQRIGLFRHGAMDEPAYADGIFHAHWKRSGEPELLGATVLELGPGDSIATAVLAAANGARAILVDSGEFASHDLTVYQALAGRLSERGLPAPDLTSAQTLDEVIARCGASYLTGGLSSLEDIPSGSIDLVFSQAVLEHVRRHEFEATIAELARVLKTDGKTSHRVDLQDHLGGSLNNLRIPSRIWEARWFARAGFYTNRLSCSEMLEVFREFYSSVELTPTLTWERPPLDRRKVAHEFRHRTDADMMVGGFDVVMRHPRTVAPPAPLES
jgi:SAM-dependent methyltransferase